MDFIIQLLIQILILVVGFAMLVKGADWFVDGAAGIAKKFGIPELVVGLTIVAMGTSAPEAAVSVTAALNDNAGITIGNVLGSNILNILVILGITGVIVNVAIQSSTLLVEMPFMLVISVLIILLGMSGGNISRFEGGVLWILFISYIAYLLIMAKKGKNEDGKKEERSILKLLLLGIIGGVIVVWGSDITVDSAVKIAEMMELDERIIGLTIVALGTSLPELVTSVTAAKKGSADIAIGNVVGSNIFNILFVVGTSALIIPVPYEANFMIDGIIAALSGALLWISTAKEKKLTRPWAAVMLVVYLGYLVYLLV